MTKIIKGRITADIKKYIVKEAKLKIEKRIAEHTEQEEAIADEIYRHLVSKDIEDKLESLPEGYVSTTLMLQIFVEKSIRDKISNAWRWLPHNAASIEMSETRRVNLIRGCDSEDLPPPLRDRFGQYILDKLLLMVALDECSADMDAIFKSVKTIQTLLLSWPEALELLPDEDEVLSLAPAITTGKLNNALGLPSDKSKAA